MKNDCDCLVCRAANDLKLRAEIAEAVGKLEDLARDLNAKLGAVSTDDLEGSVLLAVASMVAAVRQGIPAFEVVKVCANINNAGVVPAILEGRGDADRRPADPDFLSSLPWSGKHRPI